MNVEACVSTLTFWKEIIAFTLFCATFAAAALMLIYSFFVKD